jgi:acetyltransferase-like isoleucine patch superfamily enzyme
MVVPLGVLLEDVHAAVARRTLPRFGNDPKNLHIDLPRRIANPERIFFGDDVWLGPGALLTALAEYPTHSTRDPGDSGSPQRFASTIRIGHRVTSTGGLQIGAHSAVTIEDDVLLAANVYISDGLHGYETARVPYKYQPIGQIAPVLIGRGCWIGQNVVVLPGVTIGEFTIVGANSVVTESLPARAVAVGAPARVVRRWSDAAGRWESVG